MHENRKQALGEFERMQKEFDRFFESLSGANRFVGSNRRMWSPPADVYATAAFVVVKIEIGGMRIEDFQITFDQGVLTVSGVRTDPSEKVAYQRLEIAYGEFMTQVHVPWPVAAEHIEAEYIQGFLFIKLPKRSIERTRIPVKRADDSNQH
jgi:HSP20 family molecular chaperone IbpA